MSVDRMTKIERDGDEFKVYCGCEKEPDTVSKFDIMTDNYCREEYVDFKRSIVPVGKKLAFTSFSKNTGSYGGQWLVDERITLERVDEFHHLMGFRQKIYTCQISSSDNRYIYTALHGNNGRFVLTINLDERGYLSSATFFRSPNNEFQCLRGVFETSELLQLELKKMAMRGESFLLK